MTPLLSYVVLTSFLKRERDNTQKKDIGERCMFNGG